MAPSPARSTWAVGLALAVALPLACSSGTAETQAGFEELPTGVGGSLAGSTTSATGGGASTSAATTGAGGATAAATSASAATTAASTTTSTGGPACDDTGPGEPNEGEASAVALAAMDDCDPSPFPEITGVLDGPSDVDWYRYTATDASFCKVDPTRDLTAVGGARLCKFAKCTAGTTSVTCDDGATPATSPNGAPGCCLDESFSMGIDCAGTLSDDATVYVRIDQAGDPCIPYTIDYHY